MERRIFLAVILGALVMYGWQALFLPPPPAPVPTKTPTGAPEATNPAPTSPSPTAAAASASPATPSVAPVKGEASEREIVVETAAAEIVLTNRGARVLHWRLKEQRDASGQRVDLVPSKSPKAALSRYLRMQPSAADAPFIRQMIG